MKSIIILFVAFTISVNCFSQAKDSTQPKKQPDSVEVMPEKFKMELTGDETQLLIDNLNQEIQKLMDKRDRLIAQARKQITKKPK